MDLDFWELAYVIFPDTLSFSGLNYGFGFLGVGIRNNETQLIADIMSVEKTVIQGNATQAFHLLSGYVVDGYPAMILAELFLGVYFFLLAKAIAGVKKPLSIAIVAHLVMVCYYLSQAGIVQVVRACRKTPLRQWGSSWPPCLSMSAAFSDLLPLILFILTCWPVPHPALIC
jgi:hypothetical protein